MAKKAKTKKKVEVLGPPKGWKLRVTIFRSKKDGQWYRHCQTPNNQIVGTSGEGYKQRAKCERIWFRIVKAISGASTGQMMHYQRTQEKTVMYY